MKTLGVYSRDIVDNRARKTYSVRMNYSANDRSCEITPSNSQPVTQSERIGSIDTLRGFALLGILLLNIIAFSGPLAAYYDPSVNNDISGLNLAVAMFVDIWAEGAFRAIFSMLFGAGFLIFFEKSNVDKRTLKLLYYRRTFAAQMIKRSIKAVQLANSGIMHMDGDQNALTTEGEDFKKARESFIRKNK